MSSRSRRVLWGGLLFAVVAAGVSPFLGDALDLSKSTDRFVLLELRIPRVLLALCCGAGLAVAGVILQAVLRNPLATPFTLGVSSGASFGVVAVVALGLEQILPPLWVRPLFGMAGALLVITLTYRAARVGGQLPAHTLLLAGVTLTYIFSSLILAIQYTATPHNAARILRWLVGSLETGQGYAPVAVVGAVCAAGAAMLLPLGRALNALAGGEEAALSVGVDVPRVVRRAYLAASLMVGVIVAYVGPIGFVGLLVPHALRRMGIIDNRVLLAAALPVGGGFLALCSGISHSAFQGELPVGVYTQLLGGPFFLWLLLREKRRLY